MGLYVIIGIDYIGERNDNTTPEPRLNITTVFPRYGISMLKIRRSLDRLIFNMAIPVRR